MNNDYSFIDATPNKRIYRSIMADYRLTTAVAELIDNAIDSHACRSGGPPLDVQITIDIDQQSIDICDNSGGVKESDLSKLISPGASSIMGDHATIGIFGVGSKRAVVALAQHVQIVTRYHREGAFRVEYDDSWLASDSWQLPYARIDNNGFPPSTTKIGLSRLRFHIDKEMVAGLVLELRAFYGLLISGRNIRIAVNDEPLLPVFFDHWAFPPGYEPVRFKKTIDTKSGHAKKVKCELTAGLRIKGDSDVSGYGVYFYCNERLVAHAVTSAEVGFVSGMAGVPHHTMSLARVIVKCEGPSSEMPWNSSKSDINYNHPVFRAIREDIIQLTKNATALSKRLGGEYDTAVRPFENGEIRESKLRGEEHVAPSKLPKIPRMRRSFKEDILERNKSLCSQKPWARGLVESVIVVDLVLSQRALEQRNRICLIILDSMIEIALKDYLAHEAPQSLGDDKLRQLFGNRIDVHREAGKTLPLEAHDWSRLEYYYKLRCELIHKKASATVSDRDINDFRQLATTVLYATFGIEMPAEE